MFPKRFLKLNRLAILGSFILALACESAAPKHSPSVVGANDEKPLTGSLAILTVNGMSCPLCANNIDKQLRKLDGVQKVAVDLGAGTVSVDLAGAKKPSPKQLADAIHNSGFTLTAIEAK